MSLAPLEDVTDNGTDSTIHAHCGRCFPPAKFPPGTTVLALCGVTKKVKDAKPFGEAPPENACIVCQDDELIKAHLFNRHGLV